MPSFLEDKLDATNLLEAARSTGVSQIITQVAPIGPIATKLALVGSILTQNDIDLIKVRRNGMIVYGHTPKQVSLNLRNTSLLFY